jgi:hypothetical protein
VPRVGGHVRLGHCPLGSEQRRRVTLKHGLEHKAGIKPGKARGGCQPLSYENTKRFEVGNHDAKQVIR